MLMAKMLLQRSILPQIQKPLFQMLSIQSRAFQNMHQTQQQYLTPSQCFEVDYAFLNSEQTTSKAESEETYAMADFEQEVLECKCNKKTKQALKKRKKRKTGSQISIRNK